MTSLQSHFPLPQNKNMDRVPWEHWSDLTTWQTPTQVETPTWQYTTPQPSHGPGISYFHNNSPTPYTNHPPLSITASPRAIGSVNNHVFQEARYPTIRSAYDSQGPASNPPLLEPPQYSESYDEDVIEEEDSDSSGDRNTSSQPQARQPTLLSHRRTKSASEAKRAHTVVERNYRERLNDKISDLGLYLFETNSDSRSKPSKSLIMTRAKERLLQYEARNKELESEVVRLREHIAVLEHYAGTRTGDGG